MYSPEWLSVCGPALTVIQVGLNKLMPVFATMLRGLFALKLRH